MASTTQTMTIRLDAEEAVQQIRFMAAQVENLAARIESLEGRERRIREKMSGAHLAVIDHASNAGASAIERHVTSEE